MSRRESRLVNGASLARSVAPPRIAGLKEAREGCSARQAPRLDAGPPLVGDEVEGPVRDEKAAGVRGTGRREVVQDRAGPGAHQRVELAAVHAVVGGEDQTVAEAGEAARRLSNVGD